MITIIIVHHMKDWLKKYYNKMEHIYVKEKNNFVIYNLSFNNHYF